MPLTTNASDALAEALSSRDALAELLAVAGHDLRQPLQVAMLCIERAIENIGSGKASERLLLAVDALSRLNIELSEIAHVAQLGKFVPRTNSLALEDVFGRLESDWRNYATACGVSLNIPSTVAVVLSDRIMLQSILRNLVGNAIKYSGPGDCVSVRCLRGHHSVTIEVVDEGCGIPAAKLEQIFEAFIRGDTPHRTDGLGLGLTIARQFAEKLNHRISVASIEDVGSTFSITVPLAFPEPSQPWLLGARPLIAGPRDNPAC